MLPMQRLFACFCLFSFPPDQMIHEHTIFGLSEISLSEYLTYSFTLEKLVANSRVKYSFHTWYVGSEVDLSSDNRTVDLLTLTFVAWVTNKFLMIC